MKSEKFKPRARKGYLVGFEEDNRHVYRIYILALIEVIRARDTRFVEDIILPKVNFSKLSLVIEVEVEVLVTKYIIKRALIPQY